MSPAEMVLLVVLVLLLFGLLPAWPYAAAWGGSYAPSGTVLILLVVLLVLLLNRR